MTTYIESTLIDKADLTVNPYLCTVNIINVAYQIPPRQQVALKTPMIRPEKSDARKEPLWKRFQRSSKDISQNA